MASHPFDEEAVAVSDTCATDTGMSSNHPQRVRDAFAAAYSSRVHAQPRLPSAREAATALSAALDCLDLSSETQSTASANQASTSAPLEAELGVTATVTPTTTAPPNVPLQMGNGSVNRVQVRQRFLDLHFGTSNLAPFVFVHQVFEYTDYPSHIATTTAVDTMCIAQMATSFRDSRLMQTAGVMYARVAQMIARKLSKAVAASEQGCLDDMFGGIHALITCGFFSGLNISAKDRERHVKGLENMTRMISNERMSRSVREAFKYKWGRQGFWLAIKERKDLSKVDSRVDFADRWRITDSESLSQLASRVPALLEQSDEFFRRRRPQRVTQKEILAFLNEIETVVAGLKKWQVQWESAIPAPYHLRSIRSFESFRNLSGRYFEVFQTAYAFTNPGHERDFRVLQICLLSLDLTILQLHSAFSRLLIDSSVRVQLRRAEFGAELAVEALCMMVPWTARSENRAFAGVYTMPLLERAMPYFQANGKVERMEWCEKVSRSLGETYGVDFFVGQG